MKDILFCDSIHTKDIIKRTVQLIYDNTKKVQSVGYINFNLHFFLFDIIMTRKK